MLHFQILQQCVSFLVYIYNYYSFYTAKKLEICATRKDEWVRKTLELLRYETPTEF